MSEAAVVTEKLTKRFGALVAVDAIDLAIERKELFGLLGPNGAGKTTLLRILTTLQPISSGRAEVAGIDVGTAPAEVRKVIGVVPQALTSDLDLTAYENMDIYGRFFDIPSGDRRARIQHLLHEVGLWERRNDLVKKFSGGMRRRLEVARGLLHRPQVLFLDEPTIGLDPQSRHVIWDLLRDLRRQGELTIILTTHYLDEADVLCDRVAIIDHGKIVALGSPDELKSRVAGSETLELATREPISDELLAIARTLDGVRNVERTRAGLELRVDGAAHLLPQLLGALQARAVQVTSASMSRITLEEVFIHFTGRSLRDELSASGAVQASLPRRFT